MNRFKSVVAGAIVVAALASGAAAVFAQGPRGGGLGIGGPGAGGPGGRGGRDGGPGLPLRGINLTDAQEQQVRDIRQQEREGMRELQARLRAAADAHHDAVESVPVNEGLIRQTHDALAEVQAEVAIRQAHVYNQVWAVLTREQQAQVAKLRAEREARQQSRVENRQLRRQ